MAVRKLHDSGIWVIHKFADKNSLELINASLSTVAIRDAWATGLTDDDVHEDSYWFGRTIKIFQPGGPKELDVLAREFSILQLNLSGLFSHAESILPMDSIFRTMDDGKALGYHKDDTSEKSKTVKYGIVFYINDDYTGGQISYKESENLNPYFKYQPVSGDLVIHRANILHGVEPVTLGVRYISTSFVRGDDSLIFVGELNAS